MRITGGTGKGKRLKVPAGSRVRPTSDKVKQALFNILGQKVDKAVFLDLFAGTGAVGIEAISRGAERVVLVDDARASLQIIRQNVEQGVAGGRVQVVPSKAEAFLRKTAEQFDIIFLDPPYSTEQAPLLTAVGSSAVLRPDAVIVSEHFKKQRSPERAGRLCLYREAVYGDTVLAFYKVEPCDQGEREQKSNIF